jgi:hypothetical protein
MAAVQVPPSPGVGARRRGPKSLPKLPMSAFTPPNSGTSDRFPLPPSPSTLHPDKVIDAFAYADGNGLQQWNIEAGQSLSGRMDGVVIRLSDIHKDLSPAVTSYVSFPFRLISIWFLIVPFVLHRTDWSPASPPFPSYPLWSLSNLTMDLPPLYLQSLLLLLSQLPSPPFSPNPTLNN